MLKFVQFLGLFIQQYINGTLPKNKPKKTQKDELRPISKKQGKG